MNKKMVPPHFYSTSRRIAVIAATALFAASAGLQAAVILNDNGGATTGETAWDSMISDSDLVNTGRPTFLSVDAPDGGFGTSSVGLQDGVNTNLQLVPNMTFYSAFPSSVTFTLDTTVNTLGYDITTINTFAGWSDFNFGAQIFELLIKTTTNGSFVTYGTFSNTAGFDNTTLGAPRSSLTTLTGDSGPIASGVTDIRLVYSQAVTYGTVIREIDVIGTATTVPEPSIWMMMIVGTGALILSQRTGRQSNLSA